MKKFHFWNWKLYGVYALGQSFYYVKLLSASDELSRDCSYFYSFRKIYFWSSIWNSCQKRKAEWEKLTVDYSLKQAWYHSYRFLHIFVLLSDTFTPNEAWKFTLKQHKTLMKWPVRAQSMQTRLCLRLHAKTRTHYMKTCYWYNYAPVKTLLFLYRVRNWITLQVFQSSLSMFCAFFWEMQWYTLEMFLSAFIFMRWRFRTHFFYCIFRLFVRWSNWAAELWLLPRPKDVRLHRPDTPRWFVRNVS